MRRRPPADLHCPYCYEPFGRPEDRIPLLGAAHGLAPPQEPDKVLSVHTGRAETLPPAFASDRGTGQRPAHAAAVSTTTRICPACHRPLPAMFGDSPAA